MRPRTTAGLAFAVVASLVVAAWAFLGAHAPRPAARPAGTGDDPARPNVILLTIDTLRPDHLGVYGYPRPTSPNLDRFASSAVVFEDTVASSAWTSPGLVTLLTGLFAVRHRVMGPADSAPAGTPTLATILASAGYHVPNLVYLTSIPNYSNLGFGPPLKEFFDEASGSDEATRWLEHGAPEPFFLWYHYRYIHLPYQPERSALEEVWPGTAEARSDESAGLTAVRNDVIVPHDSVQFSLPGDRETVVRLYDGEIRAMDDWFGRFLDDLDRRGLLDRSLIVVSADHGEELFDHGWVGHASTTLNASLHEELVRIPLLIRFPGARFGGLRVADQARGADVLPTVLDALGMEAPVELDGRSLMPAVRGDPMPSAPAILETAIAGYQTPPGRSGERLAGIRADGWKLVVGCGEGHPRLYHTRIDPGEVTDLAGVGAPEEESLRRALTSYLSRWDPGFLLGRCELDATASPAVESARTPCPVVEEPADGSTIGFDEHGGLVTARWTGSASARYDLEYELGEGRFHTVGRMPVIGNRHEFGPFPRNVWQSFRDFNPWRVRVVMQGRSDCTPAEVRFRF